MHTLFSGAKWELGSISVTSRPLFTCLQGASSRQLTALTVLTTLRAFAMLTVLTMIKGPTQLIVRTTATAVTELSLLTTLTTLTVLTMQIALTPLTALAAVTELTLLTMFLLCCTSSVVFQAADEGPKQICKDTTTFHRSNNMWTLCLNPISSNMTRWPHVLLTSAKQVKCGYCTGGRMPVLRCSSTYIIIITLFILF